MRLLELLRPGKELDNAVVTEFLKRLCRFLHVEDTVGVGLGIEFVGIADDLLFKGLGLVAWQSGACMTLGDTGMARESFGTQHLGTDRAVLYIGLGAMAVDRGGVAAQDADVVQHGSLIEELLVEG